MTALIPALGKTLAYWQPQRQANAAGDFHRVLAAVAPPPAPSLPVTATYQVQPKDTLTSIARKLGYKNPLDLARANRLKDPHRLQVGQTLILPPASGDADPCPAPEALKAASPKTQGGSGLVRASWYGPHHHGRLMANGKPFDMFADTAAHRTLPLGTRLRVTNPDNGRSVEVAVTDRGPYVPGRTLDLSLGAARKLGVVEAGVSRLQVENLSG